MDHRQDLRCFQITILLLLVCLTIPIVKSEEQELEENGEDTPYVTEDNDDNYNINVENDTTVHDLKREDASRRFYQQRRKNSNWKWSCIPEKAACPRGYKESPLILISLDGFRAEYLERNVTPSLQRIIECGVRSRYMRPIFPTTTFPNHYSIATGLYAESHGIIDNKMYDPLTKRRFSFTKPNALHPSWWEGEPIWVTAEKQGKKTASHFWVGSEVKIKGIRPSYFRMYNSKSSWNCRMDTVLSWLELPEDVRPSLITLYFNEPDHHGHRHGPNSRRVNVTLKRIDSTLNYLFTGLFKRDLFGCVNIIFVSDHGMTEKSCNRVIPLDEYVNVSGVFYVTGAASRIRMRFNDSAEAIDGAVENFRCRHENLLVARKEQLPKRYHFSRHRRIEDIVLGPKAGWYVMRTKPSDKDAKRCDGGTHGYDNMEESMQALFVAHGPAFKQNVSLDPFLNIELYNLMADLLNITGSENNGTYGSLHHLLQSVANPLPEHGHVPQFEYCQKMDAVEESLLRAKTESCNCNEAPSESVEDKAAANRHLPFGVPSYESCILSNSDYVSSFDSATRLPAFVAWTLRAEGMGGSNHSKTCWYHDHRISPTDSTSCLDYEFPERNYGDIAARPLFLQTFSASDDVWLSSNAVPMYAEFERNVLRRLEELLVQWATAFRSVHVTSGPCFDILGDGMLPSRESLERHRAENPFPIPSHYFYVVTRCLETDVALSSCSHKSLDVLAFILPHLARRENCLPVDDYLLYHSARVKDVETLTGLRFFPLLPTYQRIRVQTKLPEALWKCQ